MEHTSNTTVKAIRICYGEAVTVLPMTAANAAERASGLDCKILMCLCADADARKGDPAALSAFADRIGCTGSEVERAISYWCDAGVIARVDAEVSTGTVPALEGASKKRGGRPKKQTPEEIVSEELKRREVAMGSDVISATETEDLPHDTEEKKKKVRPADVLPNYTMEELSDLLEKRKHLSLFIDECQRAYGKMFNMREIAKVIAFLDYLSLDEEYVLMLFKYFGEKPESERKSVHYVERMAFTLTDNGITQVAALQAHLDTLKKVQENESKIRSIFGIGERAFTAKERAAVMRWIGEFSCTMELIELAYERTVHATNKPSILYAAKILERWHGEGLKTPADVETAEAPRTGNGNFETNDFFEAALKNAYGEDYVPPSGTKGNGTPS